MFYTLLVCLFATQTDLVAPTPATPPVTEASASDALPEAETETPFGPVLNPLVGEHLTADDRDKLPSGQHVSYVLDQLFLSLNDMQNGGGRMALFDRVYLSSHGRSWTQMRFLLNNIELTDPWRPGAPLIDIPHEAWDKLEHRSLFTDRPGINWHIDTTPTKPRVLAQGGSGGSLGGGLWVPKGMFDRDPATDFGAPSARRQVYAPMQFAGSIALPTAGRYYFEHIDQQHKYPLTFQRPAGGPARDRARRTTVLAGHEASLGALKLDMLGAWQGRQRDGEGAQYRWPRELTGNDVANAAHAQLTLRPKVQGDWNWQVGAGFGFRADDFTRASTDPIVSDIETEWMWLLRPRQTESASRGRADLQASTSKRFGNDTWQLSARSSYAWMHSQLHVPSGLEAQTYLGATNPAAVANTITLLAPPNESRQWISSTRASIDWVRTFGVHDVRATAALDQGALGVPGDTLMTSLAPAAGAAWLMRLPDSKVFALLRREPDALTAQVSQFLDPTRGIGARHLWQDNGDLIPEASEAGTLLARIGGPYHQTADHLKRPSSNQFSLGYVSPTFGPFRAVITTSGRVHFNRYVARYDDATTSSYSAAPAEGRVTGLDPSEGGNRVHPKTVYDRDLTNAGNELYILKNDPVPDWWYGGEFQIVTVTPSRWFLNFGAAGYWHFSTGPWGVFPDRNDEGVIDEASADRNARILEHGRGDQDRSFSIKVMGGIEPIEDLVAALSLRYRDGQPFTRLGVITGAPQGSVPINLYRRGRIRHTFHMALDMHLAYALKIRSLDRTKVSLALDIFNLLGSATEILEDPRSGPTYRDPVEILPNRSAFAMLKVEWS